MVPTEEDCSNTNFSHGFPNSSFSLINKGLDRDSKLIPPRLGFGFITI